MQLKTGLSMGYLMMETRSTKQKVLQPTPLRLTYNTQSTPNRYSSQSPPNRRSSQSPPNRLVEEDTKAEVVLPSSGVMDESTGNQEDVSHVQRTCHWEECVTSSDVRKVCLVPDLEVFISQAQLSQVQHLGASNPRKMTIALMDIMFTRDQLAKSSAKGSKRAHNAKIDTVKLPSTAVLTIKQFVLNHFTMLRRFSV
ncbi:uncharacterized protein LOC128246383 [Mya arenaria]|uniref:uncharacterized protein LOC128246383 n=1 Tax=Mya arenaria TaxID=6604 RepID=UPI0022E459CF|nr:uncharacterized protein LOC128246383 [Mya arenaria]